MPDTFFLQGLEHPRVKAYYNFMVDVATIFGASKNRSERELRDVIQFETELVKVCANVFKFIYQFFTHSILWFLDLNYS